MMHFTYRSLLWVLAFFVSIVVAIKVVPVLLEGVSGLHGWSVIEFIFRPVAAAALILLPLYCLMKSIKLSLRYTNIDDINSIAEKMCDGSNFVIFNLLINDRRAEVLLRKLRGHYLLEWQYEKMSNKYRIEIYPLVIVPLEDSIYIAGLRDVLDILRVIKRDREQMLKEADQLASDAEFVLPVSRLL